MNTGAPPSDNMGARSSDTPAHIALSYFIIRMTLMILMVSIYGDNNNNIYKKINLFIWLVPAVRRNTLRHFVVIMKVLNVIYIYNSELAHITHKHVMSGAS